MLLADILTAIGSVFTMFLGMVSDVATTVVSTPILLLPIIVGFASIGIKYFKKLLGR